MPGSLLELFPRQRTHLLHLIIGPSRSYQLLASFWVLCSSHFIGVPKHQLSLINETMGFLPSRCTASALISVIHEWLQQLELGNEVCSIFFDLKKAFDSVSHSLLLQRLVEIEVDPYSYCAMDSQLATWPVTHMQVVMISSEQSPSLPVISGVLQGSVLGPLLFLIFFINEVVNQISPGSTISHFADDIALYWSILSNADICILQDISAVVSWVNASLLYLQPAKCCSMLMSRKRSCSLELVGVVD